MNADDIWDSQGRLRKLDYPGFAGLRYFPLRITRTEWAEMVVGLNPDGLYAHPRFTLVKGLDFVPGWDYCHVYHVRLSERAHQGKRFGPNATPGVAEDRLLAYLVEHGAVELLPESFTPNYLRQTERSPKSVASA